MSSVSSVALGRFGLIKVYSGAIGLLVWFILISVNQHRLRSCRDLGTSVPMECRSYLMSTNMTNQVFFCELTHIYMCVFCRWFGKAVVQLL